MRFPANLVAFNELRLLLFTPRRFPCNAALRGDFHNDAAPLSASSSRKELFQLRPRAAIEDVWSFEPAPSCLPDPKAHRIQASGRVSVCRDSHLQTYFFRLLAMHVVEVEPGRICVQLQETSARFCAFHHAVEVHRVAWPLPEQPPGRMRKDGAITVIHGAQDALGLSFFVEIELVVHGADREIQSPEDEVRGNRLPEYPPLTT